MNPSRSDEIQRKSGIRFERAAAAFCVANARLTELRELWRKLKQDHDGEEICCRGYARMDPADWCGICTAYPLAEYKSTLRARQSATRSMMRQYASLPIRVPHPEDAPAPKGLPGEQR